jgi:hypothetical protein
MSNSNSSHVFIPRGVISRKNFRKNFSWVAPYCVVAPMLSFEFALAAYSKVVCDNSFKYSSNNSCGISVSPRSTTSVGGPSMKEPRGT